MSDGRIVNREEKSHEGEVKLTMEGMRGWGRYKSIANRKENGKESPPLEGRGGGGGEGVTDFVMGVSGSASDFLFEARSCNFRFTEDLSLDSGILKWKN